MKVYISRDYFLDDRWDRVNKEERRNNKFGLQVYAKWLSIVPKWFRFLLVFGGLIVLAYFVNKGL